MSAQIQYKVKSASTNTTSNLNNDVNNKWTKITNTIISSPTFKSKGSNKRIRSPNIHNKWIQRGQKVIKQKKNEPQTITNDNVDKDLKK